MALAMRRLILFTRDMPRMTAFYRDVLGLPLRLDDPGYKNASKTRVNALVEFDAGNCTIALHNGASEVGTRPPKMVFFARDVVAARAALVGRGARLGKVLGTGALIRCEGKDPDGNPYSLSNRA